jgi:hypothetical protein
MPTGARSWLYLYPIVVYRGDLVNVKTPAPGNALVAVLVDGLYRFRSTGGAEVVGLSDRGDSPLVSAADTLYLWHLSRIQKTSGGYRGLLS